MPSCDLEAARELAAAALARGTVAGPATAGQHSVDEKPPATMALWQFVATAVEQWACYYQGRPTDPLAMAQLEQHLARYSFYPVASLVATTVVAAQHAQHRSMPRARSLLHGLLATPRFDRLGVWWVFALVADAYLAIISGDDNRVRERERDLLQAGAPGEQLLIHAAFLAAAGDPGSALQALHGITSREVKATGLTSPVACALEGMLYELAGDRDRADRSVRQAIAAAEPYAARRVLSAHDPAVMIDLVRRAAASRPADRWTRDILSYLEADLARTDPPQRVVVPGATTTTTPTGSTFGEVSGAEMVPLASPLTAREAQLLHLVGTGASHAQIARELHISLNTVKTHLRSARTKLGAERTGEAVALARSARWLAPEAGQIDDRHDHR